MGRVRVVVLACVLLLLQAVPPAAALAATSPTTTITSPSPGAVSSDGTMEIRGSYQNATGSVIVNVVLCEPVGTQCPTYLVDATSGTTSSTWHAIAATLSNQTNTGGSFDLVAHSIPAGSWEALTYVHDSTTAKGPRASVNFTVVSAPPPSPTTTIASPVPGFDSADGSVDVSGTYSNASAGAGVGVTACELSGSSCSAYLQDPTSGQVGATAVTMAATLTSSTDTSGSFDLPLSGLSNGPWRVITFVSTTSGAPQATVDFLVGPPPPPPPTTTITSPTTGFNSSSGSVDVAGAYVNASATPIVGVVACRLSAGSCASYLQDPSSGQTATTPVTLDATVTPGTDTAGTYDLPLANLPSGSWQVATFVDDVTPAAPQTTVRFTVGTTGTAFIAVMFGRGTWQASLDSVCTPTPGSLSMGDVAADMAARGVSGIVGVVIARTQDHSRWCQGYTNYASWDDLTMLRSTYGWDVVSQGYNYADMTLMTTDAERIHESGDTLPVFIAHGFSNAWGLFNYADNKQDTAAQTIVTHYFAFGRRYGPGVTSPAAVATFPYSLSVLSINGGKCNDPARPCYKYNTPQRYTGPSALAQVLNPGRGNYGVIQPYRLVTGSRAVGSPGGWWDCTGSDWRDHFTSQTELYCENDLLSGIDQRDPSATIAVPSTVAQLWSRMPADPTGQAPIRRLGQLLGPALRRSW